MQEHFGRMQRHSRFALLIPPDEKRQKFVNLHKKFALFSLYCSIFSNRFNLEPVCCIIADRIILSLTVQKRKTSRISSVYAGFETFFIVNRYAYVAPSFWKNRMKGARARLSLIPGAEFSTRAYLSYKRLSYFFVCLHMFLIFAIGINSFEVSNPKAWCRESVSSLRL